MKSSGHFTHESILEALYHGCGDFEMSKEKLDTVTADMYSANIWTGDNMENHPMFIDDNVNSILRRNSFLESILDKNIDEDVSWFNSFTPNNNFGSIQN